MVQVQVRDTGPGIPPEIREQIFEPFFTTKARGGASGCPSRSGPRNSMAARCRCDCPPEGGTVFTLTLPRPAGKRLKAARAPEPLAASQVSGSR